MNASEQLCLAQKLVLRGLAAGKKNCQIADDFPPDRKISAKGVDYHRRRLYLKLHVQTAAAAVARAKDLGWI